MTTNRRDGQDTEFGSWIRGNSLLDSRKFGFAAHNLDYIWYAFRQNWIILIEEKRNNATQSFSQNETHKILNQILFNGCINLVDTTYGKKKIDYRGYYFIQFEKTNPDDSKWIKINGEMHNRLDLLYLLRFGELKQFEVDNSSKPLPIIIHELKDKYPELTKL